MIDAVTQVTSRRRRVRDRAVTLAINVGGGGVIALIVLMLAYLLYVVSPFAANAELGKVLTIPSGPDRLLARGDGRLWILPRAPDHAVNQEQWHLPVSSGRRAVQLRGEQVHLFALFPRLAGLDAELPGTTAAQWLSVVDTPGIEPQTLAMDSADDRVILTYADRSGVLHALSIRLTSTAVSSLVHHERPGPGATAFALPNSRSNSVLIVHGDRYLRWRLGDSGSTRLLGGQLSGLDEPVVTVAWGPAHDTLLVADSLGLLHRFDAVRGNLPRMGPARQLDFVPRWIGSERGRRVAFAASAAGDLSVFVPGSDERLYRGSLDGLKDVAELYLSENGRFLVQAGEGQLLRWKLTNVYPETGWRSLWQRQWFAAYDAPAHIWHPDGDGVAGLSKYSLSPLLFGTFKAAIYGMLLALPIALGCAVYVGYFLAPRLRNRFKPAIEMLEAFPTVVLGFLAGLWLAPLLLKYLTLVLLLPLLLIGAPLLLAALHLALQYLSPRFMRRPPRLALVAVVYLAGIAGLSHYGDALTLWLFGGSVQDWMWEAFGLPYDQRNALLVGMAMGLAIMPTMFTLVEDAIHAVPRALSDGSLALGATRWQSLARVVLPAAAPAVLSAVLIGFARGLGETMIVLLATGNTPLMEPGIFSGLQSLSAAVAAELPEAAVGGVHYRLLFLAALVLFALTFVFNTIAELFRQRLRYTYEAY